MRFRDYTRTCARCKRVFNNGMVLDCHHPVVQDVFGDHICFYCCKHCKYHATVPSIDGIRCIFEEGEPFV